ncbi:hypothetical protein H4R33_000815 [Dimargaris cristalligena]|nr:hypothetical protein H4R33_000815 [Dimargaris cristalligena]
MSSAYDSGCSNSEPVAEPLRPKVTRTPSTTERLHGFIAGVASGITKLAVGHPFDTIKVRLQTEVSAME